MTIALSLALQTLLTFTCQGEGPVRFGFPLPESVLQRGLRVSQRGARLQWRRLQARADPQTGRVWVELAVTGAKGRCELLAGGLGPAPRGAGRLVRETMEKKKDAQETLRRRRWRWHEGSQDTATTRLFHVPTTHDSGEVFAPGEMLGTRSRDLLGRWLRVHIAAREWRRAGVLPGTGRRGGALRSELVEIARRLPSAPGLRGVGDYLRGEGVVTNLEYDTTLGLAWLGLASGESRLLRRAYLAARHTLERDLDRRTGLPFRHGPGHRVNAPAPGHCWLQGLLLVGCMAADRDLIRAAHGIARGLVSRRVRGQSTIDRARDLAWPLLELESWLRFADDPPSRAAADVLARELAGRWDPGAEVVHFGEGETRGATYHERTWLTGGMLLPALRAHQRRSKQPEIAAMIEAMQRRLLGMVTSGKEGLPLQAWVLGRKILRQARMKARPEAFFLLEGLSKHGLERALRRAQVRRALTDALPKDDPDLATSFSLVARCRWIYR